jgi:polysaccharide pyruvyl transferase WcaK-like protein
MVRNTTRVQRVGILSASLGNIPASPEVPTQSLLEEKAGRNTGNLAFRHAVTLHTAGPMVHVPWTADPAWAREQCDILLIPSSNQAHPNSDFSKRADFVESVDLPCVAVGLGAQAPHLGAAISLPHGTRRYLHAVAARSRAIGVRGPFTAEVLAKLGIDNTTVIGCPSTFTNHSPTLGATIERKLGAGSFGRIAITAGDLDPAYRELERKLFEWMLQRDGAYVCQSVTSLVSLARMRLDEVSNEELGAIAEYLHPAASVSFGQHELIDVVKARFRVFFDAEEWLMFLSGCQLAVGARIHGNFLAVQAGTPGICIYHDSRTLELCETTAMPHLSVSECMSARSPEELVDLVNFDGAFFDERRAELATAYRRILEGNGITISEQLTALTERRELAAMHTHVAREIPAQPASQ